MKKENKKVNNIVALTVTVIFSILVLYKIDIAEMVETFKLFDINYIIILVPFFIVIMVFRALRWNVLLPPHKCGKYCLYEIYMTSNLLNIFLPARAGDIFRGCYFGHKYNLSKLSVLGTVAAERILDGLTVITILLLGIILYNKSDFAVKLAILASIIFVFSFIVMLWIYKYNKIDTICSGIKEKASFLPAKYRDLIFVFIDKINPYLNSFVSGFKAFSEPKKLFLAVLYSVLSWTGDCIFIYLLVLAFGIKVSFLISFFIISFIALSTIIPSSSIYIGLYQYAFILAAELFGIDKSPALSISIMQQSVMLIAYFIIAGIFVIRNQITISDIKGETSDENADS